MYKLIFIDLDGTLLNDAKEISEENIKWLNRAYKEKGIITIITTGRELGLVKNLYKKHNCSFGDYIIASDGAIIKNIKTGEYINKEILNIDEAKKLREIYLNEELDFIMIYGEENEYMERKDQKNKVQKEQIYVDNIIELLEKNKDIDATLCIMGGEEEKLNNAIEEVKKINTLDYTPICEYIRKGNGIDI